ncbi:AraC family transcriptional regulator [Sphingobium sp. 3R8]|uniref:helix-turn-helix domain-containing protein n=1 Tax=Sphingobium sp. 3R8 TaxID=2874921 RepID=UPI001CCCA469|nr:AraC family transcriptional regulator [Sphingobium sp. 3R8]MBZ9648545.1 AraC family transcriptional regulator [Sphingobium sp. 3R8]
MPMLSDTSVHEDWVEPDIVPRAVVTYGIDSDVELIELDLHTHLKGQIILVERGALSCEVEGGLWIVPPGSAIWIPGGPLKGYNAFVAPDLIAGLPTICCAVSVTLLLRELLTRTASLPLYYEEDGATGRLVAVLLDEIAGAKVEDLHLPMPRDQRLRRIVDAMMAAPAERGTLEIWASRSGMSERSLLRLISRETGMSFGRWRQQLGVMLAIKWLAGGASIQQVAADLGYESVPSFVTMFRKAIGTSPGRYMAERYARRTIA